MAKGGEVRYYQCLHDTKHITDCPVGRVPVTAGYANPIYRNPLFQSVGEDGCASAAPHVLSSGIDYRSVGCPVCEQVCEDTCWVRHQCLLANEDHIRQMAGAIVKVCENAEHIG